MLFSVIGISIVSVAVCILLREYKPEFAMTASLLCGVLIFGMVILNLTPALDTLGNLISGMHLNSEYFTIVLKSLGICYVTQLASDTCRDSGYSAIASKVELAGKVSIVVIALPLFTSLVDIALGLIQLGT